MRPSRHQSSAAELKIEQSLSPVLPHNCSSVRRARLTRPVTKMRSGSEYSLDKDSMCWKRQMWSSRKLATILIDPLSLLLPLYHVVAGNGCKWLPVH